MKYPVTVVNYVFANLRHAVKIAQSRGVGVKRLRFKLPHKLFDDGISLCRIPVKVLTHQAQHIFLDAAQLACKGFVLIVL